MIRISDDLVIITKQSTLPPFPLSHARIGYQSFVTEDSISASSQSALFPAAAVANTLTAEFWRPENPVASITFDLGAARDVDYIGIGGHDLSSHQSEVVFESSFDGVDWVVRNQFSPGDNLPIMLIFETLRARFFRLGITAQTLFRIGAIYIGQALVMQRPLYGGHTPVRFARETEYNNVMTEAGQFAGRQIIRKGVSNSFEFSNLKASWVRSFLDPFIKAARERPFFIAWRPDKFPSEVGFVWTTGDIQPSNSGTRDYMSVTLDVVGVSDD